MSPIVFFYAAAIASHPLSASRVSQPSGEAIENIFVSFADLDIRTNAGQSRLKSRIAYAAYRLCLVDASASPSPAVSDPACVRDTIGRAEDQVNEAIARAKAGSQLAAAKPASVK